MNIDAQELTAAAGGDKGPYLMVPDANHFYAGCGSVVVDAIDEWLEKNDLA